MVSEETLPGCLAGDFLTMVIFILNFHHLNSTVMNSLVLIKPCIIFPVYIPGHEDLSHVPERE